MNLNEANTHVLPLEVAYPTSVLFNSLLSVIQTWRLCERTRWKIFVVSGNGKGKAIPLQAWKGP